jgi:hypothetical protein
MREKSYLLTYKKGDKTDFDWFDTEEEMDDFIETNEGIEILDALYIADATNIR